MANEPVQLGTPILALGFGDTTIGGILKESLTEEPTADIEYIKGEDTASDEIAIVSNKGKRYTAEGFLHAGATLPVKGDVVAVGSTPFIVESCQCRRTSTTARVTLTLYKPDAASWSGSSSSSSSSSSSQSGNGNP